MSVVVAGCCTRDSTTAARELQLSAAAAGAGSGSQWPTAGISRYSSIRRGQYATRQQQRWISKRGSSGSFGRGQVPGSADQARPGGRHDQLVSASDVTRQSYGSGRLGVISVLLVSPFCFKVFATAVAGPELCCRAWQRRLRSSSCRCCH